MSNRQTSMIRQLALAKSCIKTWHGLSAFVLHSDHRLEACTARAREFFGSCCVLVLVLLAAAASPTLAQESVFSQREQNLVGGLRDRSLYDLAESHCLKLLDRDGLTPTDHASVAIERIRIQTSKSRTGADREQQWQQVDQIAKEFSVAHPDNPRAVLVGLQQALAHLSFGRLLQQEVAARSAAANGRELSLKQLAIARSVFERTQQLRLDTVKAQANQNLSVDMLSSDQLRALGTSLDYQLAIVNLTSAQLADPNSETENLNRIDSLGRVLKQLTAVRTTVSQSKPLWWQTKINEASCRRMLGEFSAADQILKSIQSRKRPRSTDGLLLREQASLAIAIGDAERMRRLAAAAAQKKYDAETEISLIQLLVASGQIQKASRLVNTVSSRHGAYWARRADVALLSGSGSGSTAAPVKNATVDSAENRLLLQAAENAEKNGDLETAVRGFLSVAESQFSSGDRESGLSSTVRAGMVLEKQSKHDEAASIFLKPARAYASEKLAPSIHLRGCWNLSKAESDRFGKELVAHIDQWPNSETASQARYWLASQQLARKDFTATFETLVSIDSKSPNFPAGVILARIACRKRLGENETKGLATGALARRLLQRWEEVYLKCPDSVKPLVAVAMAELGLGWQAESTGKSAARLKDVAGIAAADSNVEFQYLLPIADDGFQSGLAKANAMPFDAALARRVLLLIDRIEGDASRLAKIKLSIAENAIEKAVDSRSKNQFLQSKASALVALGKRNEAVSLFEELIAADPKNLSAQLSLARVLPAGEALKRWRSIASRTASHSSAWFEAKYNVARLLHESGKSAEAAKLLKYIKAVPPGWKDSTLKKKFESLLRESAG